MNGTTKGSVFNQQAIVTAMHGGLHYFSRQCNTVSGHAIQSVARRWTAKLHCKLVEDSVKLGLIVKSLKHTTMIG